MSATNNDKGKPGCSPGEGTAGKRPDWTAGLKRLYDSVVEEPLPESFKDLLSRLDDGQK
jgi:hypothetical protein